MSGRGSLYRRQYGRQQQNRRQHFIHNNTIQIQRQAEREYISPIIPFDLIFVCLHWHSNHLHFDR